MNNTELLERLGQLDSCAVSDALDRLKLEGVVLGLKMVSVAKKVVGKVQTVQLEEPKNGQIASRHLGTAAVDASGPGDVIVIAHQGRLDVSGWGGLLSQGAIVKGIEGIIVDGACRDVDESRLLGLPIYARATVPITARNRVIETAWNIPVKIGGVTVTPGDLVVADGSGVVFLAAERAEEIIATAEEIFAKEQAMAEAIRAGHPMSQVMGASYEQLLQNKE